MSIRRPELLSKLKDNGDNSLIDGFGRVARKLRLSVTDRCNMQCIYCMPRDADKKDESGSNNNNNAIAKRWLAQSQVLSYDEFLRVSYIMARLGIEKIRVTGGG